MELASINGNVRSYRLDVPRGLFVLRYVDREISQAPIISVRPLPGSEHSLTITHHPDLSPTILDRPGAAVVVSSQGRASLEISAQARAFGGSLEARVDLEPLVKPSIHEQSRGGPDNIPRLATSDTELSHTPDASVGLSILGHVSRRGDVVVQGGNWIAGPDAPSPIEGVEIRLELARKFMARKPSARIRRIKLVRLAVGRAISRLTWPRASACWYADSNHAERTG